MPCIPPWKTHWQVCCGFCFRLAIFMPSRENAQKTTRFPSSRWLSYWYTEWGTLFALWFGIRYGEIEKYREKACQELYGQGFDQCRGRRGWGPQRRPLRYRYEFNKQCTFIQKLCFKLSSQFSTVMTVSVSTTPLKLPMLKKKWIQWRSTKCKTKLQYARFEPDWTCIPDSIIGCIRGSVSWLVTGLNPAWIMELPGWDYLEIQAGS